MANAEHVSTAESKRTLFFEVMDMPADKFASTLYYGMTVMKFFDLPDSAFVAANKDAVKSVAKWRDLYDAKKFPFVVRNHFHVIRHILEGKVACVCCRKESAYGTMLSTTRALEQHEGGAKHKAAWLTHTKKAQQVELTEAGLAKPVTAAVMTMGRQLAVGSLVAGGDGAAGVPPTAIPALLNGDFLKILESLPGGMPCATTISNVDIPAVFSLVQDSIRSKLEGKTFSIGIDGGSSHLADGAKTLAAVAMGPQLEYDLLLDVQCLPCHETGTVQAKFLNDCATTYKINTKKQVKYIVADNASVNSKTVKLLIALYGWVCGFARCFPHTLSLVLVAFLAPWIKRFNITTHLKAVSMCRRAPRQRCTSHVCQHSVALHEDACVSSRVASPMRRSAHS